MTEIEEKSLKTQLTLCKEIRECDNMIIHLINDKAKTTYKKVVESKSYIKEGQENVEFTIDEFNQIKDTLQQIMNKDGMCKINSWIKEQYILPKEEKLKILSML